ncbi:MAG: SMC family ATPase [Clostridia bacterium]|nr:SMC family ATPase [Clostridia bacterium]
MKPINLKIKGINSYVSEQNINFERLAESNIFGIFGETGSGKTTILDSIILALYGVSDRDSLQNIINVNTKDAYIEFTFEMEDSSSKRKRYFIRRDFKLRPSGLKTEAILTDTKSKTLAEMPDNVNNKVLEIIGIGKKEFTKCIALPQGEFDRFLSDTPALRKKTLAKLFDLEQFGIILNDKLKKRKTTVSLNKSTLEEKISVYQGINQETIDKTEAVLKSSDEQVALLQIQIGRDKKLAETIKNELRTKDELLDNEVNLSIKQSEVSEINFIEKQIEYTEKYGDFSVLNNKYNNCMNELDSLSEVIETNKNLLEDYTIQSDRINILLEDNHTKTEDVESQLASIEVEEEKRRLHEEKLDSLQEEKAKTNAKILELSSKLTETNQALNNLKSNILDMENNHKKLENAIFDNMDVIDKLSNCQTFKTKQDFALFLTITKNKINPDSLAEVENFNIYDEVTTVVHDIENYELGVRKEVGQILRDLKDIDVDYENIDQIKDEYLRKNELLNKKCDELEDKIASSKEMIASTRSIIEGQQIQANEYNDELERIKKQIAECQNHLKETKTSNDKVFLTKTLAKYKDEEEKLSEALNKIYAQKQKAIIDIEISTNNISNLKDKINQLATALKPYNKATFKDSADTSLLVPQEELPELRERVANFHKELAILENNTAVLREKTKDYIYTKDDFNALMEAINDNEEKLTELKVFINVNKITIDIQKQNLQTVLALQEDLDKVNAQYEAILKLEGLLAGGALIDFVSEEYMGLITDFANSYVYKISKGKYLLNYDGDFNVIDNFNGGIKRSVKTLSGGERFIVSLSLALGISQSIAVNNNKNFNFFFIDEGFGNLSDNYIEKVLQSFDALINLNFTVGFITHVEKMQYYLNSKLIVTKGSNDEGSKIEEIF